MGFKQGGYAHIWKVEEKGNYSVAEISTSKKNKTTDEYETDWSNKFVRLVGTAHDQIKTMDISKNVKIGACEVTNKYDKEKNTTYTNYVIFGFEDVTKKEKSSGDGYMNIPDGLVEDLPFN